MKNQRKTTDHIQYDNKQTTKEQEKARKISKTKVTICYTYNTVLFILQMITKQNDHK